MKRTGYILTVLAAPFLISATEVSQLTWMVGDWISEKAGEWTEEHWSSPRGGFMLGYSRSGMRGNAENYEFLRIEADKSGTLNYYASPESAAPTAFKLVKSANFELIFENETNDFPQRIWYVRQTTKQGPIMVATISQLDGSRAITWRYQRKR